MKVLAIGAHPDDIEIFMYGILSVYKKQGKEIFLIVATDGSLGGSEESKILIDKRKEESLRGLSKIGKPVFLGFRDGSLRNISKAYDILKSHISNIKPDLIITHAPEDYHQDHRALSKFVSDAANFICPVIYSDTLMGVNFLPNFYVDISEYFKFKVNAIMCHQTQNPKKFVEGVEILNRFRAAQCNAPSNFYAEAFRYDMRFPFADIRILLPNPPPYKPYYKEGSSGLM